MLRSSLIAASAILLCGAATAQESSPLNWSVHQGQPKFGGTYHLMSGKWTRQPGVQLPDTSEGALTRVYDNSCLWTGGAANTVTFNGAEDCEDIWDDGRVPGSASGVAGATDDNLISAVTFAHITFAPVGTVDVELNFYNALGGACVGFASPNPPAPAATGSLMLNAANGTTLPGDPTGGGTAWFITIDLSGGGEFCLLSEGDGSPGSGSDNFNWSFSHNNPSTVVGMAGGPIIASEPLRGTFGACTYSIACGSDPIVGACGSGQGNTDAFWQNVGGDPAGPAGTINTSLVCTAAATGTGCFFFGGWPNNAWASYFLQLDSAGSCATIPPVTFYCTGKTGSNGCIPFLTTDAGTASVSGTTPWNIRSNDENDAESGFLIYSFKKSNLNFHGGKLCVKAPFVRTPIAKNKAVACIDPFAQCTTTSCRQMRRNFNAAVQGGGDPMLTAGQIVRAQMRQRDPTEPLGFGDNLSDGVNFTIAP